MMQSKAYSKARDLLAQNSALLATVNDAPGKPQEFRLTVDQDQYHLPVEREKQLSEDFAFLAAREKGPTTVMAVAIEEDRDKQGMTFRVAVNQGDLSAVKDGLTRIAQIMQRASTRGETRDSLQPQLLQDIITLDCPRILSRLRSSHAPSGGPWTLGEPIIRQLKQQIDDSLAGTAKNRKPSWKDLQTQCKVLATVFNRLEALQPMQVQAGPGRKIMIEIVQRILQLLEKFDLSSVLKISKNIDPGLLKSLPLLLGKLARYHKLSYTLIEAARDSRYTIFKTIRVVTLDANDFAKTSVILKSHSFDEVLDRFKTKKSNPQVIRGARLKPWTISDENGCSWKIHAEIQLLSYYQFQKVVEIPRVLSSSKGSCYLCCQFIRAHGQFQVPRTHGRLYRQWTLPDIPNDIDSKPFLSVIQQLNQQLENEIRKALPRPVKKIVYPNESVTGVNLPWSPASTVVVLPILDEGNAMSPVEASLSLPNQDSLAAVEVLPGPGSCGANLEAATFEAGIHSPHIAPIPELEERLCQNPVISNQTELSLSTDNDACLDVTSDWSCHRLSSSFQGIWFHCDRLDLYLNLVDNDCAMLGNIAMAGSSTHRRFWIGIKSVVLSSDIPYDELENCFDVAHLDLTEHISDAGAASSKKPLVLIWLDYALILQCKWGGPPEDPFQVT